MLVQQGDGRSVRADAHLAWSLAGIAGALNTGGFFAAGFYTSNMTGNVSSLADHAGTGDFAVAMAYLALIATFIAGAAASTVLINAGKRRAMHSIYALSIMTEAVLLGILGCIQLRFPSIGHGALLAFGLSFLLGLQNAVVTRISKARVRTTHVTGMITDIGIELGTLVDHAWHDGGAERRRDALERLRLHGLTVASFMTGGIVGVLTYERYGAFLILTAAAILLVLAGWNLLAGKTSISGAGESSVPT